MNNIAPSFSGEVQLASWSESHSGGCKIVLWLADPSDLDAFRAMTVRKGNVAGQRFMAVLVEIGDDEQPVQQQPAKPSQAPTPSTPDQEPAPVFTGLTRLAIEWCEMPMFWAWCGDAFPSADVVENAKQAKDLVCHMCCISSRKELNTDQEAAAYFNRVFRRPFSVYLEG